MVGGLVVASMIVAVVGVAVSGLVRVLIHACIVGSSANTSRASRRATVVVAAMSQVAKRTITSFKHLTNRVPDIIH